MRIGFWSGLLGWAVACGPTPQPVPLPSPPSKPAPVVAEAVKTLAVAVERDAACARRSDGSVWCWGDVFDGYRPTAGRVKGLPPASDLAVGDELACIVAKQDGAVWCWGRSAHIGDVEDPTIPRRILGLPPATRVAVWQGDDARRILSDNRPRACALARNGAAWCWKGKDAPQNVGGEGATDLAMGAGEVCVLQDGAHHCTSVVYSQISPLRVLPYARRFTTLGFAGMSRCGHVEHGTVHCWGPLCGHEEPPEGCDIGATPGEVTSVAGGNDRLVVVRDGRLHDFSYRPSFGGRLDEAVPQRTYESADVGGPFYACGVTADGETQCWGEMRVGPPAFDGLRPRVRLDAPVHHRYLLPVTAPVAVAREAVCGADAEATLRCWVPPRMSAYLGLEGRTRLHGYSLGSARGATRAHVTTDNICLVFANAPARCLNRRSGSVLAWEGVSLSSMHHRSACGVFGPERELRCRFSKPSEEVVEEESGPFRGVEQMATRELDHCAVRQGRAYCYEREKKRMVPVDDLPDGVTEIALGHDHRCALADGQVWCWGRGGHGQLGRGRLLGSTKPLRVEGLAGVQHIAAAFRHTCALDGGGHVHCWGGNMFGQLGDGTRMSRPRPTRVEGLSGVLALQVDDAMTCAVRRNDTVCWGQGAWNAFAPEEAVARADPSLPTPVLGIGQERPPPPKAVTVEVKLP